MTIDPIRAIAYIVLVVIGLGTGWQIRDWKAGSDEAARLERKAEAEQLSRDLIAGVAKTTLEAVAGIKVTSTTIYQKTRHEITHDPIYVDCRVPADGMLLINSARAGIDRSGAAPALSGSAASSNSR